MMRRQLLSWIPSILVGGMLAMTGAMKLMMNPDAAKMFADLGGTPALLFAGVVEVAAAILILIPKTRIYGAALAAAMMLGAIGAHIAVLEDDSMLPVAVLLLGASWLVAVIHRAEVPVVFGPWVKGF